MDARQRAAPRVLNRRPHVPASEAGDVLKSPDDVIAADHAEQEHIQGEGGGSHIAVPEDEPAEQARLGAVRRIVEVTIAVHEEQEHVSISQVGAGRNPFSAEFAVLVAERQVPGGVGGHEVEHPAGQLVVVDACVARRCDRVHGPRCGLIGEQLMLFPSLPPQPVVDAPLRRSTRAAFGGTSAARRRWWRAARSSSASRRQVGPMDRAGRAHRRRLPRSRSPRSRCGALRCGAAVCGPPRRAPERSRTVRLAVVWPTRGGPCTPSSSIHLCRACEYSFQRGRCGDVCEWLRIGRCGGVAGMATGERLRCRRSICGRCHLSGTANSRRRINGPTWRVTSAPNTVRLGAVGSRRQDSRCSRSVTSASGSVDFQLPHDGPLRGRCGRGVGADDLQVGRRRRRGQRDLWRRADVPANERRRPVDSGLVR